MKIKSFFIALIICALPLMNFAQAQNNLLKVKGKAEVKATPEIMNIHIPIEAKETDYERCSNKLTGVFNQLKEALIKTGIDAERIKSDQLRISEDYKYVNRERVLIGYVGNIKVEIEMDHTSQNLQKVMKTLNDERFNFGYSVQFSLAESQKDSLRQSAIKTAVADAREKANILAESLDIELGAIHEVNFEHGNTGNNPLMRSDKRMYSANMESSSGNNEIELNPKEISLTKTVDITWLIAE